MAKILLLTLLNLTIFDFYFEHIKLKADQNNKSNLKHLPSCHWKYSKINISAIILQTVKYKLCKTLTLSKIL